MYLSSTYLTLWLAGLIGLLLFDIHSCCSSVPTQNLQISTYKDKFSLLVNTKKIEGPSWHSRYLRTLHKTIKLDELKYNNNNCRSVGVQNAGHEVTKRSHLSAWSLLEMNYVQNSESWY